MEIKKALARIASGYRRFRTAKDAVIEQIAVSNTNFIVTGAICVTPLVLYTDLDGTWSHMLAEFNDRITPLDVKISRYVTFLEETDCWRVFLKFIAFTLALDVVATAVRFAFWWRGPSVPSPQS